MDSIPENNALANLPVAELQQSLAGFLEPLMDHLPEERLRCVGVLAIQGILAGQSPLVAAMARGTARDEESVLPTARRIYRFLWNERFSHRDLLKGLYGVAQRAVARHEVPYLVVALDGVNFEKPYTEDLEGVSTVQKSTPPGPHGEKRLTSGYPALTATVVNLPEPVVTYASWFSYVTADFVSEPRELYRAIRTTWALLPHRCLRFVGDAALDDKKVFAQVALVQAEFIFRVCHDNRRVEVYNERLARWESERLDDLIATVPLDVKLQVAFNHARKIRQVEVRLGWLQVRLPDNAQVVWFLVAHDPDLDRDVVLITNVPITGPHEALMVYTEWRYRPRIEHTYRFDQERGLDVEDMQVQTLERMRRLFVLVLLAALFIYFIAHNWSRSAVRWLRLLGGKLGLAMDSDGTYVLLAGISAVLISAATIAFASVHPFPEGKRTCG